MGKSVYNSVDELPDLSDEPVHTVDPQTKKVTTYKSIDELPDLLKKKVSGELPSSVTPSPSQLPQKENKTSILSDFGILPTAVPKYQQSNQAVSTDIAQPKITATYDDFRDHNAERKEKHGELVKQAITNTANKVLKNKGVIKPEEEGKELNLSKYMQLANEKKKLQDAYDNGDATFAISKDGEVGLKRTTGWWESLSKGWNHAMKGNDEAAEFADMDAAQKVDFLKKKETEQPENKHPEYLGERGSALGSLGGLVGENAPFLVKAGEGAALGTALTLAAPITGGTSLAGLPAATAFIFTANDAKNQGIQSEVTRRFYKLKKDNPEANEVDLMKQAEQGALAGGLAGIATNAALMTSAKTPLSLESKNVVGKAIQKTLGSTAYAAGATAGIEGAKLAESNLEGIKTTSGEVAKQMGKTFSETATTLGILHVLTGAATGAFNLPKTVRSAMKYALTEDAKPQEVQSVLKANVEAGNITQDVADKVQGELDAYSKASGKVVEGLSPEAHASVAGLIEAKDKLVAEAKTKDDSAKDYYDEKIDGINQQIQKTINTGKPYAHEVDEMSGNKYTEQSVSEPISKVEPTTQEQGSKEPIPESTEPVSASTTEKATTILNKKFPKPEQDISEMSADEINDYSRAVKQHYKDQEVEFFGEEGAKKYREARSISNSEYANRESVKKADAVLKEMEDSLTKEQSDAFFGVNEKDDKYIYDADELRHIARTVRTIEESETLNELSRALKIPLLDFSKNPKDEGNLAAINAAKRKAQELGVDPKELIETSIKNIVKDLPDRDDKEFLASKLLSAIFKPTDKEPIAGLPKSENKPIQNETAKAAEISNTETQASTSNESTPKVEQPTKEGESRTVGASHEALKKIADRLGLEQPERGEEMDAKTQLDRGRLLLSEGANPEGIAKDFIESGKEKVSADEISVARAHQESLHMIADKALTDFGKNSEQYKETLNKVNQWEKDVLKPMGTVFHKIGVSLQGETDLDTGSFTAVKKHVESITEKPLTPDQEKAITELTNKNKELSKKLTDLQAKFTEALDKNIKEEKSTKEKTKKSSKDYAKERTDAFKAARDALKKLRSGQSGLGVSVPFARELAAIAPHVAKIVKSLIEEGIDKLGDIVDQLHDEFKDDIKGLRRRDILDVVAGDYNAKTEQKSPELDKFSEIKKQAKLTKKLQDLQEGLPEDYDKNKTEQSPEVKKLLEQIKKVKDDLDAIDYMKEPKETLEEKHLKSLEKELTDLRNNIEKNKPLKREFTDKEKDLIAKIQVEKDRIKFNKLVTQFANKTDNKFTTEEVKEIWDYAKKNYIDKGKNVPEMLRGVAMDLGLTSKQVLSALEQPKGVRVISDSMFLAQSRRTQAANKVKEYAKTANQSNLVKWAKAIPNFFFQKAIFGHGTVGMITHAGMNIFRPSIAKIYFPLFIKQFKNSFGALTEKGMADYEKSMTFLKNDPLFPVAKRAGVKVDPTEQSDDYSGLKKWLGKVGMTGDRGFNALKEFRLAMFKNEYNRLSDVQKADPNTLKEIGKIINHATGTSNFQPGGFMNTAIFAPRLEASKWARVITDPAKAISTFSKWDKSTMAEKAAAKIVARKSGELLATYIGALAVNQALLYATGSKQQVNYTNPTKKDYLKFKMGDEVLDLSGGIIPTSQFVGHLLTIPFENKDDLKGKTRKDEFVKTTSDYALSKLSPFASTAKDVITAHDFMGNTMPWSEDKPLTQYAHKLSWGEYLLSQQAPIPMAEAAKDIYKSMQERGMSEVQIDDVLTGLAKGAISGATGAKLGEDYSLKNQESKDMFTTDELESDDLKPLKDKGVEVPSMGTVNEHKIRVDDKHPSGVMSTDEFKQFNEKVKKDVIEDIKGMLKKYQIIKKTDDEGHILSEESILGKDLNKKQMSKRIKVIKENAENKALRELNLKRQADNETVKEEKGQ